MEDIVAPDVVRDVVSSFIQQNHWLGSHVQISDKMDHIENVEMIRSEQGEQVIFDELA